MMTCNKTYTKTDRFLSRVLAGLLIAVVVTAGALVHAVAGVEAYI